MEVRELTLIENMYINNYEATELINAELSMVKDTESDTVVVCYRDEIDVSDNGDYFVKTDDYFQVYFDMFGEMLVTDKIEDDEWKLLITLFGNDDEEHSNDIHSYVH